MVVFFGTQMYGKVDKVPMLGHVATSFFYLQFVPLVPLGTYLVLDDGQGHISVGFSFKSLLIAWLRTALVCGTVALGIVGVIMLTDSQIPLAAASLTAAVLCALSMAGSYYLPFVGTASYERAMALADQVGATPEFRLTLEVHYGRKSAQQAEMELARIYDEQQRDVARRQEELDRREAERLSQMVNPFAQDAV